MPDVKDVIKKLLVDKDINKEVKSPKEESLVSGAMEAVGLNVRCFFKATSNVISSSSPIKPLHVAMIFPIHLPCSCIPVGVFSQITKTLQISSLVILSSLHFFLLLLTHSGN